MASTNDLTPPAPPSARPGWFSRLKTWQKVVFLLLWPISGAYGLYGVWKQQRFSQLVRVGLSALYVIAMVGSLGSSISQRQGAATPANAPAVAAAQTTASATSSSVKSPKPAQAPADLLAEQIRAKLPKPNRTGVAQSISAFEYEREALTITYAIRDNLNQGLVASGAAIDATKILELTHDSGLPVRIVQLKGTFSMVDKLGNAEEAEVINALYSGETLGKINFDNFLFKNIWSVSENASVHPEFRIS